MNIQTRIFGVKRKEEAGCSIQLHTEASHNLQLLLSIIMMVHSRNMRWAGHVAHTKQQTKSHTLSVLKTERKSRPGRINPYPTNVENRVSS